MNTPVTMPQLSETVAEGTVTRWLHAVGDAVVADEPLLEVSTDKVDIEVPSPASGTVVQILVQEDATVAVGTVLAVIGARDEVAVPAAVAVAPSPAYMATAAPPASVAAAEMSEIVHSPRHQHSPRVRRLARESGVALATLVGTGPRGRVTPGDVLRAATEAGLPPHAQTAESSRRIAELAVGSLQTAAHRTAVVEVDLTRVVALRERIANGAEHGRHGRLTLTAFSPRPPWRHCRRTRCST